MRRRKLGLLALIGAFALEFAKVIAIGIAAFFARIWTLFGRRQKNV